MPGLSEILSSLQGAWLLMRRDASGYGYLNLTEAGFWHSFAAIAIVAPFHFMLEGARLGLLAQAAEKAGAEAPDAALYYFGSGVTLVVDWISFPIAMIFVCRLVAATHRYAVFVIAFNWCSVLTFAMLSSPTAIYFIWGVDKAVVTIMGLVFLVLFLSIRWFVARTALETTGLVATMVVILEFTMSIAVQQTGSYVFGLKY